MTTYRSTKRDAAIADDFLASHAACGFCGISTPRDDLAALGARCRTCYAAYCAEANPRWWPNRPLTADERAAVIRRARQGLANLQHNRRASRQWAHDLQAKADAGQVLTHGQMQCLHEALGQGFGQEVVL